MQGLMHECEIDFAFDRSRTVREVVAMQGLMHGKAKDKKEMRKVHTV